MTEEVKVPAVGGVPRKAVYAIGGTAAAYLGYRWWRNRSTAAAAGATPVDTLNTAADQSAVGFANPGGIPAQDGGNSAGLITTNAAWSQAVESALGAIGYDPQAVATALGLYLSSQPLTGDQQMIIRVAWGLVGKPPENTGLPIIPVQTPPTGGTSGGTGNGSSGGTPSHAQQIYVSNATLSLNGLADAYGVSAGSILAATTPMEPSDVAAYLKLTGGTYSHVLPSGTKWVIPAH